MLKHRLLMSALLIPATIGLFVWDDHLGVRAPVLFVFVMFVAARCVWELVTLVRVAGFRPNTALVLIGTWFMIGASWWVLSPWSGDRWPILEKESWQQLVRAGGALIVVSLLNAVFRFSRLERINAESTPSSRLGQHVATLGIELFIVAYIGVLLALTCQLRWVAYSGGGIWNVGYFALSALIVTTKMGDVGAYTFGRLIGGPKMTPKLSPGKTWAGGIGHLVTAGSCSAAWLCWLGPRICSDWPAWGVFNALIFGVIVGFAGLIGDLAESLIKRDFGVKDAPALLPGFGGLLDLMDSILLAGPVAYAMWHLLR